MNDTFYINRCIQLAEKGLGNTYPNPMVGSVIVCNNKIIGEGWHQKAGEPHAEVHAIQSVKDLSLLKKATIYVSLEPCAHHGKTPPCADLIIKYQIPKVVIGIQDPFAKVNGLGIEKLKNAGCEVLLLNESKESLELNKRFFTFHQKKRPYIILKWAETKDGFIDRIQKDDTPTLNWITNSKSKQLVHKWRTEEQAILIGKNTALNDNPQLNVRLWSGNNPVRIVIDRNLEIPQTHHLYYSSQKTIFINQKVNNIEGNLHFIKTDFNNLPKEICRILHNQNIQSVIIEGGKQTSQSFIDSNLWDEARVFIGNKYFETGIKAPVLKNHKQISQTNILDNSFTLYTNTSIEK